MKILYEINLSQKMNGLKILSEIKLDLSFPDSQFSIPGYRIFRKIEIKMVVEFGFTLMKVYLLK